ncbi:biliverdin-producing heme oxygenase [Comamonas sp. JC664]|uniref:biliverdin-producing heme oxygenase n=1 Tax=Comamonas sp. JC664 TaxID=2801917 RepID=UPI00174DD933|nr:biliverdin-producing heme oxygenase [Comamonas sp. JC664]MBL0697366.1 biliverdin-producing heme oxygenase [Comamonas sp. JC664]GHG67305.1 biliverdin-producing heme oxygenase [Comamonas sp. KCTC 72670]
MQRLKSETRPHHERTEAQVRLMDAGLTRLAYRRHLEALLGFYAPLEEKLAALPLAQVPGLAIQERWKRALLEEDLVALGHDAHSLARLPRCQDLPALPGLPEALGCLYVLEGSSLGGQLILRHLRRQFEGEVRPLTFSFFNAYGDAVGPRWRAFGEAVNQASEVAADESFDARVVKGAQETFDTFAAWLRHEQPHASLSA